MGSSSEPASLSLLMAILNTSGVPSRSTGHRPSLPDGLPGGLPSLPGGLPFGLPGGLLEGLPSLPAPDGLPRGFRRTTNSPSRLSELNKLKPGEMLTWALLQFLTVHARACPSSPSHQVVKMREELDSGIEVLPTGMTKEKLVALGQVR